ncbi:hypothetical protein APICC_05341 [Apis cerana cerana]|uniref:Uncharacterized protein n=1 Tax=Apis cerana cerana TaxID=94128 RepID=A0A2A3EMG2_APICC|nr:hypothetical protein APICC_05341 [Apis cerana cerana]
MEEEYNVYPYTTCKKCAIPNYFGKCCYCAQKILYLKEKLNMYNCTDECTYDTRKKRIVCTPEKCKTRRKLHFYKNTSSIEDFKDEVKDDKIKNNTNDKIKDTFTKELKELEKPKLIELEKPKLIEPEKPKLIEPEKPKLIEPEKPKLIELEKPELIELEKKDKPNKITPHKELENKNKSDQITPQFYKVQDEIIDTFEEKSEQTVPTKDNTSITLNTDIQTEIIEQEEIDENSVNELGEINNIVDVCAKDKKIFERIQKDLLSEKKQTEELEKKLKSLTCNINCLKEDSEQRAACLKDALQTAEEQRKIAMDLVKQSKIQRDSDKEDKTELLNEITKLQQQIVEITHKNNDLLQERDILMNKLKSFSEDESKKCEEVEKEVNKMKYVVKEKENALNKERSEFINMILELTNIINIQKRRICKVTGICNEQQNNIHEKDKKLSQKDIELAEIKTVLHSNNSTFKEMDDKIKHLQHCLCEERQTCDCLKQELETSKENHLSELRIKEKMIDDQNKTISKQKKLLHDSEEIVQQVASEFNELKDELHKEKQKNESLQITLDQNDSKLSILSQCEQCKKLTAEIDYLKKEKQKAIAIAKCAYQKLHQNIKEYQKKLICERKQHRYMQLIIERKQHEIGCLRNQMCHNNMKII